LTEYAFAVGRGTVLKQIELPLEFREISIPMLTTKTRPIEDEPTAIQRALKENKNVNTAAQSLGMSRATFWRKRKTYDI
jgi:transcriptional regulator of acetoin/glycerol metabolism